MSHLLNISHTKSKLMWSNNNTWRLRVNYIYVCMGKKILISTFFSVSEQPIDGTTGHKVARPVARQIVRPLTIWNSRFHVLNMTIDLVATDLPLATTHDFCDQSYDLCDQSYVLSTICLRFQHFPVADRS